MSSTVKMLRRMRQAAHDGDEKVVLELLAAFDDHGGNIKELELFVDQLPENEQAFIRDLRSAGGDP